MRGTLPTEHAVLESHGAWPRLDSLGAYALRFWQSMGFSLVFFLISNF